ncbi:uncharacterized protein LOC125547192 [Triticum urartu]|uniref:uncharacterized protein LOC125547192 n=1 Tax=Triticum urartu TaxID=4572 RepID=UPI002042D4D3|nr:uncharacterized protein LOC125547192 [Triticum urartu]
MAEAAAAAAAKTLLPGLPDEIVVWEILVRLDPKSILRSRAVRRDWRCATTNRRFLLAHHARQRALPILSSDGDRNILTFDHRAATASQLHTVARLALSQPFKLEASCDGLLILSKHEVAGPRPGIGSRALLTVCNSVTRQHASLTRTLKDFNILGMYAYRPTGEYRLLLQGTSFMDSSSDRTGCYVLKLGSDEAPRYIGCSKTKLQSAIFHAPVRVRDSLHCCDKAKKIVDIWVLQNYESEVWDLKYRVDLTIAEICAKFEGLNGNSYWHVTVVSGDGDVLLLVRFGQSQNWLFYVDTNGKLVASFQDLYVGEVGNKKRQILLPDLQVAPDFWKTLEHYW